jgi:glutamate-1-semialdehyde 2,1-aminomutase
MERVAPAGDVYQAGTLSGNPLAVAAARATLALLDQAAYERLEALTQALAAGLGQVGAEVQAVPGLLTPFMAPAPVRDYDAAAACDLGRYAAWCRALLDRGVYPPASQFEAWFPSLVHTEEDVEITVRAAQEAWEELG